MYCERQQKITTSLNPVIPSLHKPAVRSHYVDICKRQPYSWHSRIKPR